MGKFFQLVVLGTMAVGFFAVPSEVSAGQRCRPVNRGRVAFVYHGPYRAARPGGGHYYYYVYAPADVAPASSARGGDRLFYPPPEGTPATPSSTGDRYYYPSSTPSAVSNSRSRSESTVPRAWRAGDPDPGFTHGDQ